MCDSKNSGLLNLKVAKMDSSDDIKKPERTLNSQEMQEQHSYFECQSNAVTDNNQLTGELLKEQQRRLV